MPLSPDAFDEGKARTVAWLTAWDSQASHRTGASGDEAGAVWLAREAASFGIDVATEPFELNRLDPLKPPRVGAPDFRRGRHLDTFRR